MHNFQKKLKGSHKVLRSPYSSFQGFTLIELIISMVILAFAALSMMQLFSNLGTQQAASDYRRTATLLAHELMEEIESKRFAFEYILYDTCRLPSADNLHYSAVRRGTVALVAGCAPFAHGYGLKPKNPSSATDVSCLPFVQLDWITAADHIHSTP